MTQAKRPGQIELITSDADGREVKLHARPRSIYPERFFTMFIPAVERLAVLERPSSYWRVLLVMTTKADPIQWRTISAWDAANAANLSLSSADRAIAQLVEDGVLLAQGKTNRRRLRLNNQLAWMSTAQRYAETGDDPPPTDGRCHRP